MRPSGPVAAASAARATGRLATLCVGVQPLQTFDAWHVCGEVHEPHDVTVRAVPQLSLALTVPQFLPSRAQNAGSLSGVHAQTLFAWHVSGAVHAPHDETLRAAPQLSVTEVSAPQFL